jgi:TatD DNase family protein
VKRAWEAGVRVLVATAFDQQSCRDTLKLAERSEFVVAALGYHPWFPSGSEEELGTLLDHPKVVALGEIGLDSKVQKTMKEQVLVLDWQLDLALSLDLPVVLHCRGAAGELLRTLKRHQGTMGVIHGFHYEVAAAAPFLALGLHFSLSGVLTLPGDNKVKRLAAALPLDRLLLETDSPALPVDGVPRLATEPAHLPLVFEALCGLRPEPPAQLAGQLLTNAGVALGPRLGGFLAAASRVP